MLATDTPTTLLAVAMTHYELPGLGLDGRNVDLVQIDAPFRSYLTSARALLRARSLEGLVGNWDRSDGRCLRYLLLVMCAHPFAKEALTLHLARSEGHERYFGCNLMHHKVLASSQQHLMAEAPTMLLLLVTFKLTFEANLSKEARLDNTTMLWALAEHVNNFETLASCI